eukprot:TRINITY_DN41669_c0_g1_i1.p1 TRINITY_DN41669_c0_g1~~TRINITY_DN41669_c0_g1_i1.p1  ORF type:complete len:281 (-),score=24.04 TRINITY_DN41669_c0_g1_i1:213-1055(-)
MLKRRCLHVLLSSWLAFWAGYADVITFVRHDAFAASMTGNMVLTGRCLYGRLAQNTNQTRPPHHWVFYASILSCYWLGALTYHVIFQRMPMRAATLAGIIFTIIAGVCDVIFNLADTDLELSQYHRAWFVIGLTPLFGVQAALSTNCCLSNPTTATLSHLDLWARMLAKLSVQGLSAEEYSKVAVSMVTMLSFVVGTVVGDALGGILYKARWAFMPVIVSLIPAFAMCDAYIGPLASKMEVEVEPPSETQSFSSDRMTAVSSSESGESEADRCWDGSVVP